MGSIQLKGQLSAGATAAEAGCFKVIIDNSSGSPKLSLIGDDGTITNIIGNNEIVSSQDGQEVTLSFSDGGAPAVGVTAVVTWMRVGFSVSISGRASITAGSPGNSAFALNAVAHEGLDTIIGESIDSASGVVTVVDMESGSPTLGHSVASGFISDDSINFSVPAAGDYMILFVGHVNISHGGT